MDAPQTPAEPLPTGTGQSSSVRKRSTPHGLQRHNPQPSSAAQTEATSAETPAPAEPQNLAGLGTSALPTGLTAADRAAAASIADIERNAPRLLQTNLDLHLNLQTGQTTAHAKLSVQNSGSVPLTRIVLQISGSLGWQSARLLDSSSGISQPLPLNQHHLLTDVDHTGIATEAVLPLQHPLAPGTIATLDLFYGGTLGSSSERLLRLGAPAGRAALSDWDTVSEDFTGLRGFGNVLWTPSAAAPVLLSNAADFVAAVDAQRLGNAPSRVSLSLTVETDGPTLGSAFFLGMEQSLAEVSAQTNIPGENSNGSAPDTVPDIAPAEGTRLYTAAWPLTNPGPHLASLFLTAANTTDAPPNLLRISTKQPEVTSAYASAAERLRPMLEEWLGPRPSRILNVLDLPLDGAQPFTDGNLLVAPTHSGDPALLALSLSYPLAASWLPAGTASWIAEGLPEFLRLLYLERSEGREAALVDLSANGSALVRREAFISTNNLPLAECVDAVCARTKGAYVFSMLRQIVGDNSLKLALTGWISGRANQTVGPSGIPAGKPPVESDARTLERLLETASGKDLHWFFSDWVDRDTGLPDLTIVSVAPRRVERGTVNNNNLPTQRRPVGGPIGAEPVPQPGGPTQPDSSTAASRNQVAPKDGSWLIAVEVQNNGSAAAEVPVTVRSGGLQNTLPLRIAAHGRATIRVPFETAPEEVWVNDGTTPEVRSVTHHRSIDLPENLR